MSNPVKTTFKDGIAPVPSGSSDLSVNGKGSSSPAGDFSVNGDKVVIGAGLHECYNNIKSNE
jgi:hypothetical protein